ncbi:MAG: hypothetical protein J6Z43_03485 [Clostridiales bacterium]|nr:hypothetical protein [Clostridiales bacterium]
MDFDKLFEGLTEEQKIAAKKIRSKEDAAKFLQENNIELNPDQLEAISGGFCWEGCGDYDCGLDS